MLAVLRALGLQVDHIHVALRVGGGDDDFEPRHLGAGGDEAHVALALTARLLPCRSGLQSSWLTGWYASAGAGRRIHQINRIILIFS